MRRCVIFNPAARGEKARKFRDELQRQAGGWELIPTTGPGAARRLAREAVDAGCETVIAAGNDGTLDEVVADPADVHARAAWYAQRGACHLDQFELAERATDWRGRGWG